MMYVIQIGMIPCILAVLFNGNMNQESDAVLKSLIGNSYKGLNSTWNYSTNNLNRRKSSLIKNSVITDRINNLSSKLKGLPDQNIVKGLKNINYIKSELLSFNSTLSPQNNKGNTHTSNDKSIRKNNIGRFAKMLIEKRSSGIRVKSNYICSDQFVNTYIKLVQMKLTNATKFSSLIKKCRNMFQRTELQKIIHNTEEQNYRPDDGKRTGHSHLVWAADAYDSEENWQPQQESTKRHGHKPMNSIKSDIMNMSDSSLMMQLMKGYDYHVMLDARTGLMMCWNIFYHNKTVSFRISSRLPPDYWFGVGFSNYGELTNGDFAVFWNDPLNTHHFQDSWTDQQGILHSDDKQDYFLLKATTDKRLSVLDFTRRFDTCDDQDYIFDTGTTHIVYFTSKGTPTSCVGQDVRRLRHGFQRVQLLKPALHLPSLPHDVWTFDITAPKIKVPGVETTYWWFITKLPNLKNKQHIIRYEGNIQQENEGIVHHIEVFHCFGDKEVTSYSGPKIPEGKMDPSSDLARCKNVIGAWAMGAKPIIYPEEAGSPIGGRGFSRYVLLEVHYHNPHLETGHVDSSGIRFFVTPTLRQYDMGIMELGLEYTDKMAIPPHQEKFILPSYCIADCTKLALPKEGINIVASQLHTHLTGKRVWTKHVRNGVELPEVNRDNHYSPHFQEVRLLQNPVNVLPGDALITECEDTTASRSNVTYGGFSISEEMCVNYIHYYPKVDLEVCKSSISYTTLYNFFYFMKRFRGAPIEVTKGIKYNYSIIPWSPANVELLNYLYLVSPISMQCNQSDGSRFPGKWEGVPVTKIIHSLNNEERPCS